MRHILLTPEIAEAVKGRHGDHSYLEPYIVEKDGEISFALPEAVLYDPEYLEVKDLLSTMPIEDGWEIKQTEEI